MKLAAQKGEATKPDLQSHLADSLKHSWKKYKENLKSVRKNFSPEPIHDLRVSSRRLIALADLILQIIAKQPAKKLKRMLKKRLRMLSPLRDLDIQAALSKELSLSHPELKPFASDLDRRKRKEEKRMQKKLPAAKNRKMKQLLANLLKKLSKDANKKEILASQAVEAVDRVFAKVAARKRNLDPKNTATIHRMRVDFKKFRYLAESLEPFLPGLNKARIEEMHAFQTQMGDIQDIVVMLAALRSYDAKKGGALDDLQPMELLLLERESDLIKIFLNSADKIFTFWNPNVRGIGIIHGDSREKKAG